MIPVAAPNHPLGARGGPVAAAALRDHVQLVLSDRSGLSGDRDRGVRSARTWRIADVGAKRAMIVAGLGWGALPAHLVETDLAEGRLRRIEVVEDGRPVEPDRLPLCSAYRRDRPPGPAGRQLLASLGAFGATAPLKTASSA